MTEHETTAETDVANRGEFWTRITSWVLVIGGLIGFLASFTLTVEKLNLLKNPDYRPSCSINAVFSCSPVMASWQASLFKIFPNPLLGIAGFAVVITIGMGLLAGARYANWFWAGLQLGVTLAVGFVGWLIYSSLYDIRALCLYCMVVWSVTIPIFLVVTVRNLMATRAHPSRALQLFGTYLPLIVFVIYLLIGGAILDQFWNYFFR
ncbi:MAG: vitamin K epoxide reductase family protein [Gordonia sp. (in: high G+C Gram-positive bacteria)]|uniref:vitamin K epoxide reductase family protein n=1 Tax=Gordonia sp. (in: high G+C Gram-positive bacteria) TaxID=84139 RepID=UPI0039E2884B